MIERRRLFFRSDFLSDITQLALFQELLCSLQVYYQEQRNHVCQNKAAHPNAGHQAE
jgi:hypothetical protein